jgi:D-alanine-D-alanine ligase
MDKTLTKRIFAAAGIPTAAWAIVPPGAAGGTLVRSRATDWGWPLVVKPSREGSSVGVSIVHGDAEVEAALELARTHHGEILVERFNAGAEIDVGVVGQRVLGAVEIRPAVEFYTYEAKYLRSDTQYLVPAPVSPQVSARLAEIAGAVMRVLGATGCCRVDTRVTPAGEVFVLELNTLPGMTPTSLLPKLAAHAGMTYAALCEEVLDDARLGP